MPPRGNGRRGHANGLQGKSKSTRFSCVQVLLERAGILAGDGLERYAEELGAILSYIDKLKEVDTENVAITSQVNGLSNILREDKVAVNEDFVRLVKMAPEHEDGLISVKAVFDN